MFSCVVRIGSLAVSYPEVWARMYGFFTMVRLIHRVEQFGCRQTLSHFGLLTGVVPKPSRQVEEKREHEEGAGTTGTQRQAADLQWRPHRPGGNAAPPIGESRQAAQEATGPIGSFGGETEATY